MAFGVCHAKQGHYALAIEGFEQARREKASDARALIELGWARFGTAKKTR